MSSAEQRLDEVLAQGESQLLERRLRLMADELRELRSRLANVESLLTIDDGLMPKPAIVPAIVELRPVLRQCTHTLRNDLRTPIIRCEKPADHNGLHSYGSLSWNAIDAGESSSATNEIKPPETLLPLCLCGHSAASHSLYGYQCSSCSCCNYFQI